RRGIEFGPEHRHAALTEPLNQMFERILGASAVSEAFRELQDQSNEDAARIRPFDGALELIEHLRSTGRNVGIWTNRDKTSAELILRHTGLDRLSHTWLSGNCVTERKPHPEGLIRMRHFFGTKPSEMVMVGDHEHDVTAGKQVGTF